MNKLLAIVGPTATGKTSLALDLARKFKGDLVSADSRQVYKSLDIGTGKDIPENAEKHLSNIKIQGKRILYYQTGSVNIWGYDFVKPKDDFSVAEFIKIAGKIVREIISQKKMPIVVGGTGLYVKSLIDGIDTSIVPSNKNLRSFLMNKTIRELFLILAQIDPIKSASLNRSDSKNSRRLIRAIEIAQWQLTGRKLIRQPEKFDVLFIGLAAPKEFLYKRIEERVDKRIKQGMLSEIRDLFSTGVTWEDQSMSSLGYKEWQGYLTGKKTYNETINTWIKDERDYVKRQITWFKRDTRINWYDVTKAGWKSSVEKKFQEWYSSSRK